MATTGRQDYRQYRRLEQEQAEAEPRDDDAMYEAVGERDPMLSPSGGKGGGGSAVHSLRLQPPAPKCNDLVFAVLFAVNVAVIAVLAVVKGVPAVQKSLHDHLPPSPTGTDTTAERPSLSPALVTATLLAAGAGALALVWLRVLLAYAASMIRIALWTNVAFTVVFALATFAASPLAAVLFLVMAAINVWYIFAVSNRIGFASANLKAACSAVGSYKALFGVAIALLVLQVGWLVLWTLSAIGINQMFMDADPSCKQSLDDFERGQGRMCGGSAAGVALFFQLISVYWGQQVLQNVLTCSAAGVVATWWYQPQAKGATLGSLYRSLTTSFGSICFGSLIVAVLQALRSVSFVSWSQCVQVSVTDWSRSMCRWPTCSSSAHARRTMACWRASRAWPSAC